MPGTFKEIQDSFDQVVPGAAGHSDTFLGVVQRRCSEAGLGLELRPMKADRRSDRVVMRGSVTFGNAWKGTRPYTLEVYADPIGPSLQVGYQLTTSEIGGMLAQTNFGSRLDYKQSKIHNDPNTQRQLSGILQSFHQLVFLPTLQDLVDAIGVSRPSGGFLGA
jgi:hypothetical protein